MMFDVIVIGAGPAGSSAALALARQGRAVAIVEKSVFPRRKVCGEFVSATNLSLFDAFGVGEAWRAEAGPEVRRVGFFAGGRKIEATMPAASGRYGRALGRDLLDTLLLSAARNAGVAVFQPWQAIDIARQETSNAVTISSSGQQQLLRAHAVVAAHGSWEQGRLPSQLPKIQRPDDLFGFKAHFRAARLATDLMPLFIFPGGYGGMVWSDHGRLSISCCIRRDVLAAARSRHRDLSAGEAAFHHIAASCRGVAEAVGNMAPDDGWLAAGPIRPGIRPACADGIFRVGNLAGESHPIIAEGISMAIQSGWLLAAEMKNVGFLDRAACEAAGRRYSAAWRKQFRLRIAAAAGFAKSLAFPGSVAAIAPLVERLPGILTFGARLSGKTTIVSGLD